MGRKRHQPILNGKSVGLREVRSGCLFCQGCGEWKRPSNFNICRSAYTRLCKDCDSDRVAYINMAKRIDRDGETKEVQAIQKMERQLEQRKARLRRYIAEKENRQ